MNTQPDQELEKILAKAVKPVVGIEHERIREAIKAINRLITQAKVEELEELKSYDWDVKDDQGNDVYVNDGISPN